MSVHPSEALPAELPELWQCRVSAADHPTFPTHSSLNGLLLRPRLRHHEEISLQYHPVSLWIGYREFLAHMRYYRRYSLEMDLVSGTPFPLFFEADSHPYHRKYLHRQVLLYR